MFQTPTFFFCVIVVHGLAAFVGIASACATLVSVWHCASVCAHSALGRMATRPRLAASIPSTRFVFRVHGRRVSNAHVHFLRYRDYMGSRLLQVLVRDEGT